MKSLQSIDGDLLRRVLKAQENTPLECLYLETGAEPINWILAQRRINFQKCILSQDSTELVWKVFEAQMQDSTPGDFIKLVEKDMLGLDITMKDVEESTKVDLKKAIKGSATIFSFAELKKKFMKHQKIKLIQYDF